MKSGFEMSDTVTDTGPNEGRRRARRALRALRSPQRPAMLVLATLLSLPGAAVSADQDVPSASSAAPLAFRRTRIESRPAASDGSDAAQSMRSTDDGLAEQQGSSVAGGVIVNLDGRFGTLLVVERGDDGQQRASCVEHPQLSVAP